MNTFRCFVLDMFDGVICLLAQKWAKMSENVVLHNDRLLNSLSGVNKSGISCIPLIQISFYQIAFDSIAEVYVLVFGEKKLKKDLLNHTFHMECLQVK